MNYTQIMEKELLQYVSDIDNFIGENWDQFVDKMSQIGFNEQQVNELNERLGEYLADNL